MCSDYDRGGIQFTNSTNVVLKSLTIATCGGHFYILQNNRFIVYNILFVDINNITLEWVSVQNGSGIGLFLYNVFNVLITNSTFANNEGLMNDLGNAVIFYDDQVKRLILLNQILHWA